jgi:hypothetical protein
MYKFSNRHFLSLAVALAIIALSSTAPASAAAAPDAPGVVHITSLVEDAKPATVAGKESHIRLNSKLLVIVSGPLIDPAAKYTLFFNDALVPGLEPPDITSYLTSSALRFKLQRSSLNDVFWRQLLGSPSASHVNVSVSVGHQAATGASERIVGTGDSATFGLLVFTNWELALATAIVLLALFFVWGHARNRTTLRDSLLPQLEASRQPFSLGRSQMAFWFTLIFAAFVVLFFILQDTNVLTSQALLLMGISGTTAAAAIAVDVAKTSPADNVNVALQALGLKTYEDVVRVRQEIIDRQQQLAALAADDPRRVQLQVAINDRTSVLRMYEDYARPFVSQGWWKDVTTDINGPTVHRMQVVFWTLALGAIFLYGVYRNLAMPEFNGTLLALMGISSAGYVGFKVQEVNN